VRNINDNGGRMDVQQLKEEHMDDDKAYNAYLFRVSDLREFAELFIPDDASHIMDMFKVWVNLKIAGGGSPEMAQYSLQATIDSKKEYTSE
jgi:hypothetical protein